MAKYLPENLAFVTSVQTPRSKRYEIRRSYGNGQSYYLETDNPQRNGHVSTYATKEQAQRCVDKINAAKGYRVTPEGEVIELKTGKIRIKLIKPVTFYKTFQDVQYEVTFPKGWEFSNVFENAVMRSYDVPEYGPVTLDEAITLTD